MRISYAALLAPACLLPFSAAAQSGYISPDGKSRYQAVTIFCPNGTGVTPCVFGGGGGGSTVSINLGGNPVAHGNPFPTADVGLDALISGGALSIGGSVTLLGTPGVSITGTPTVSVSNFPGTQTVAGSLAVSSLPALPAGSNTIGTIGLSAGSVGSVTAGGTAGSVAQAVQGIAGGVAQPVSGVFWQSTQPVSAASWPLSTGAATDADLVAPYAPVAPAAATASKSMLMGCLANTSLPAFTAGQEGAVPCDTSGRPYVVTVPSANNVPGYLQAVSTGGATTFAAANAVSSCMATNVKATSGMLYGYSVSNSNTAGVWLRLFASAAAPTCGSGTPVKRVYVPASSTVALSTDVGWVLSSGIGFDVTTGSGADTDTTVVATASTVLVNLDYK